MFLTREENTGVFLAADKTATAIRTTASDIEMPST
jgi:hypothetical protein